MQVSLFCQSSKIFLGRPVSKNLNFRHFPIVKLERSTSGFWVVRTSLLELV